MALAILALRLASAVRVLADPLSIAPYAATRLASIAT